MKNILEFLNSFIHVSEDIQDLIAKLFKPARLLKGEYFVTAGEYAKEIAFLESGYVRAFYVNNQGKEYNKTFFAAPTIIGSYAALISKQKNMVAQQALTDCNIWKASFPEIEKHSQNRLEIERLRRIIAESYFLANEKKELEMALLDAEKRYKILQNEYPEIEQKIPQYHIASYLGISPTQLSRIRKNLSQY